MGQRTPPMEARIKAIAESTSAGIWRIKRAKIILGRWEGRTIDELVLDVRVPPESVATCLDGFAARGIAYFDDPPRKPTAREVRVERVLALLDDPPSCRSNQWRQLTVHYIGRDYTAGEIWELRSFIDTHPGANRAIIVECLCEMFGLYQRNGKIKKSTAWAIIKRMAMDNIIHLPEVPKVKCRNIQRNPLIEEPSGSLQLHQHEIPLLRFELVDTAEKSLLWREMIERFHYVKVTRLFGYQLRYLVYGGSGDDVSENQQLLAALGFAASTWRLASRDSYIGWPDELREKNLHLVVNNIRFLILPWIKSKNLASRILGGVVRQLPLDWERRHHFRPVLLETYVQLDRHSGTSYRASNWIQVGTTKGYSLYTSMRNKIPEKAIFLYPLQRDFRRILNNRGG